MVFLSRLIFSFDCLIEFQWNSVPRIVDSSIKLQIPYTVILTTAFSCSLMVCSIQLHLAVFCVFVCVCLRTVQVVEALFILWYFIRVCFCVLPSISRAVCSFLSSSHLLDIDCTIFFSLCLPHKLKPHAIHYEIFFYFVFPLVVFTVVIVLFS